MCDESVRSFQSDAKKQHGIMHVQKELAMVMHAHVDHLVTLGLLAYMMGGRGALLLDYGKFLENRELNPRYISGSLDKGIQHSISTYDPLKRVVVVWLYKGEFDICMIGVGNKK
jgi:hypothetical protein